MTTSPSPLLVVDGRYMLDELIAGEPAAGIYRGHRIEDGALLHVSRMFAAEDGADLRRTVGWSLARTPALHFVGRYADSDDVVLVEDWPRGTPLTSVRDELRVQNAPRLCVDLAAVLADAVEHDVAIEVAAPQFVHVSEDAGAIRLSAWQLRPPIFFSKRRIRRAGWQDKQWVEFLPSCPFDDPLSSQGTAAQQATYVLGTLVHYLFTGRHPLEQAAGADTQKWLAAVEHNLRDPFNGPPEIDALLARALRYQPAERMPFAELHAELRRLAG